MTNATPTGSVCPLRRPPKGKDHPSASRTAFFGLPPDSRNPSSPQPSRLLDSPHYHADVGLADEKSGLVPLFSNPVGIGQEMWNYWAWPKANCGTRKISLRLSPAAITSLPRVVR